MNIGKDQQNIQKVRKVSNKTKIMSNSKDATITPYVSL